MAAASTVVTAATRQKGSGGTRRPDAADLAEAQPPVVVAVLVPQVPALLGAAVGLMRLVHVVGVVQAELSYSASDCDAAKGREA